MKGIWIILGIVLVVVIIAGAVIFTTSNNSGTGSTGTTNTDGNQGGSGVGNTGGTGSSTSPTTYDIEIKNFAFSPSTLTIKKGDTVKWTNQDSTRHTATSDSRNELDSELLAKGDSYSHTFNSVGTFNYHCTPHPSMKAKIIVE